MLLYRGLSVQASKVEQIISAISQEGLVRGRGRWQMGYCHPGVLDSLFQRSDLSTRDTRPVNRFRHPAVCACGEAIGAEYYAWRHNRWRDENTPIMIEFDVQQTSVAVDGRDFLYTAFQFGDPSRARPVLERSFGAAVLPYVDRAWAVSDNDARIAICDLAVYDPQVVKAHYASQVILGGRHGTLFRNAFLVKLPVDASAVIRVWSPAKYPGAPAANVLLPTILRLKQD